MCAQRAPLRTNGKAANRQPRGSCSVRPRLAPRTTPRGASAATLPPTAAHVAANTAHPAPLPAVGDQVRLRCERLGSEGMGVCLLGPTGLVVLVRCALPGMEMIARVTAVRAGYAEAEKLAVLAPHHDAVDAPCPHFGPCGGCTMQNLAYGAQLTEKARGVAQLLARVGGLPPDEVERVMRPPVAAATTLRYRNKMQFTFGHACGGDGTSGALGLLLPGSFQDVLPISECHLQVPEANAILRSVAEQCRRLGLAPHDPATSQGVMRHVILRSVRAAAPAGGVPAALPARGAAAAASAPASSLGGAPPPHQQPTHQQGLHAAHFMVVLVTTAACAGERLRPLVAALTASHPCVVSVAHSVEAEQPQEQRPPPSQSAHVRRGGRKARAADGDGDGGKGGGEGGGGRRYAGGPLRVASTTVLWGAPQVVERLCGLEFAISPHSFFQTNTEQAEALYELVSHAVGLRVGTIGGSEATAAHVGGGTAGDAAAGVPAAEAPAQGPVVLDLYCGTGTIGLMLAARGAARVVGYDVSVSAVADARDNARRNGVANAEFVAGDLDELAARMLADEEADGQRGAAPRMGGGGGDDARRRRRQRRRDQRPALPPAVDVPWPDVVVVDPMRAGLTQRVVSFLRRAAPQRLVYVSCNAATLARDLRRLREKARAGRAECEFRLVSVTPLDMYPHTPHMEVVTVLERLRAPPSTTPASQESSPVRVTRRRNAPTKQALCSM